MCAHAEVDGIKPAKTSNGMYINPLSKAKQVLAESTAVVTDSSALEGNTASGMIDNQHHAGLQTEYRLKSFSAAAVAQSPTAGDMAEPKMPRVTSTRADFASGLNCNCRTASVRRVSFVLHHMGPLLLSLVYLPFFTSTSVMSL